MKISQLFNISVNDELQSIFDEYSEDEKHLLFKVYLNELEKGMGRDQIEKKVSKKKMKQEREMSAQRVHTEASN